MTFKTILVLQPSGVVLLKGPSLVVLRPAHPAALTDHGKHSGSGSFCLAAPRPGFNAVLQFLLHTSTDLSIQPTKVRACVQEVPYMLCVCVCVFPIRHKLLL